MDNPATRVPFYGVAREYAVHRHEILQCIDEVLATGSVLQGEAIKSFEERIARSLERRYAVAVGSCTDALYFALLSLGIGPGDEVLVTNFSFVASASAILRVGALPVFLDVDETYNIDLDRAETRITSRTRAMVFVHLFGLMSAPTMVEQFACNHNLKVVEDAAQAHGAAYDGQHNGKGSISCISFDPTKVISAPGTGGVVLTDDLAVSDAVCRLRYHGAKSGQFEGLGYNSQMSTLVAAVLNFKLGRHDAWLARRRQIASYYIEELQGLPVVLPCAEPPATHAYHKFVIRSPKRDDLRVFLQQRGIETKIHYPLLLSSQPLFAHLEVRDQDFPNALEFSKTVLSIPVHPFLEDQEVERVVGSVRTFYG